MKHLKRVLCTSVSLILAISFSLQIPGMNSHSDELTNDVIKAKEEELAAAQKEKKSIQSNITNVKSVKQQLEKSKADATAYVTQLDNDLNDIRAKIEDLEGKISVKEQEIADKEVELEEALAVQKAQYEAMKIRIKFMYEKGEFLTVDLMLGSKNFSDALNKAEYIEKLSEYDKKMLDQYVAYCEYVTLCKETLEEEKQVLDEAKVAQEKEKSTLQELVAEGEAQISSLNTDIDAKAAAQAEYEAELAEQNEQIKMIEAAIAEERKKLASSQGRKYDGGKFCNPCPSVKRISSEYGNRTHPILGTQQFHNGIDMAAPAGSPILAAYDGTVSASGYSSSMGNYAMINHGDGLYTIYMHATEMYVHQGQEVSRGQQIGTVGSTGRSTGPHLHFSVRVNGNYTSPWNYLSR